MAAMRANDRAAVRALIARRDAALEASHREQRALRAKQLLQGAESEV
jgi:hypothetical protein